MEVLPAVVGLFIGLLLASPCLYMAYRNNVVYNYRVKWLSDECGLPFEERHRRFNALPSYDAMMWQLFTFNWDHCWKDGVKK